MTWQRAPPQAPATQGSAGPDKPTAAPLPPETQPPRGPEGRGLCPLPLPEGLQEGRRGHQTGRQGLQLLAPDSPKGGPAHKAPREAPDTRAAQGDVHQVREASTPEGQQKREGRAVSPPARAEGKGQRAWLPRV